MKKILFFLSLLISISTTSFAAITLVGANCASSSNSGVSAVVTLNATGASIIAIHISYLQTAGVTAPVSSPSNSFTALSAHGPGEASGNSIWYYVLNPSTGASQTFTENNGSSNYPTICAIAFSGTATSSAFDVQNGATSGSATSSLQTGSVTPTINNEVVLAGLELGSAGTASIDTGFIIPSGGTSGPSVGNAFGGVIAYSIQTTATPVNPTFSSTASGDMSASIATFKAAAASAATTNIFNSAILHATSD